MLARIISSRGRRWLSFLFLTLMMAALLSVWLSAPGSASAGSGGLLTADNRELRGARLVMEPDNPADCEAHLALTFDSAVTTGSISAATEQDCYTFDAAAGDKVRVVANESAGSLFLEWEIQDAGTNTVCGPSLAVELDCLMPSSGTYTLWVGDYYNANTGSYRLKLLRLNSPAGCAATPFGRASLRRLRPAPSAPHWNTTAIRLRELLGTRCGSWRMNRLARSFSNGRYRIPPLTQSAGRP